MNILEKSVYMMWSRRDWGKVDKGEPWDIWSSIVVVLCKNRELSHAWTELISNANCKNRTFTLISYICRANFRVTMFVIPVILFSSLASSPSSNCLKLSFDPYCFFVVLFASSQRSCKRFPYRKLITCGTIFS